MNFPKRSLSFSAAVCAICLSPLSAVTIVSWGPGSNIVASQTSMTGGSSTVLSLSTLRNPTVGPAYYPNNTGKTPEFYGASDQNFRLRTDGGVDSIGANQNGVTETNMIVLWTQDLFINGGDSGSVTLTGINDDTSDNSGVNATVSRYVIRLGSSFYVSETFAEGASGFSDPSAVAWFDYDPTANFTTVGSSASISDFSNLTAAGVYVQTTRASAGTIQSRLEAIDIEATVIPEPSWAALAMAGGIGGMAWRRRRQKAL